MTPLRAFVSVPRTRPRPRAASPERGEDAGPQFAVRVLDNDRNTYEQVMRVVMAALGATLEEAYAIAWTVDHEGSCVVARCGEGEAEAIADHIRTIGIEVRVEPVEG